MVVTQLHLCVPFFVGRFARETCTPLPTHVHELCVPFFVGRFVRETCTPSPTYLGTYVLSAGNSRGDVVPEVELGNFREI